MVNQTRIRFNKFSNKLINLYALKAKNNSPLIKGELKEQTKSTILKIIGLSIVNQSNNSIHADSPSRWLVCAFAIAHNGTNQPTLRPAGDAGRYVSQRR